MDIAILLDSGQSMAPPLKSQEGSVLSRNDQRWELFKQEIEHVYMKENNTLPRTMLKIEEAHGFKASPRKWKDKLKEWGFEKNLSESDMKIVVAKVDKRKRAGKETDVFLNGVQMPAAKIDNFKRRKIIRESDPATPSASTPGPITYNTPRVHLDMNSIGQIDEAAELENTFANLEFSAHESSNTPQPVDMNVLHIKGSNLNNLQNASGFPSSLESQHYWENILVFNALDGLSNGLAEHVSMGDSPHNIHSERILSAAIGSSSSDGRVSLQLPNTKERSRVAGEHDEKNKHDQTKSSLAPALRDDTQETVRESLGENSLATGKALEVITSPNELLIRTPEERNLVMLGKAIDDCFQRGRDFELDLTLAQVLSILTYFQGADLEEVEPPMCCESYWRTKSIAALAREYIETKADSAAVSIFLRVIAQARVVLGGGEYLGFMPRLEKTIPFSCIVKGENYLKHETVVLQIVLASFFKFQLASQSVSSSASRSILGVVERLRCIQTSIFALQRNFSARILRDLTKSLRFSLSTGLETSESQFRRELLSTALSLANCYSESGEFEIAETLFHLRLIPLAICPPPVSLTDTWYSRADELYVTHKHRRHCWRGWLRIRRVLRWTTEKWPAPTTHWRDYLSHVRSINPADLDVQIHEFCQKLINPCTHASTPDPPLQQKDAENSDFDDSI